MGTSFNLMLKGQIRWSLRNGPILPTQQSKVQKEKKREDCWGTELKNVNPHPNYGDIYFTAAGGWLRPFQLVRLHLQS